MLSLFLSKTAHAKKDIAADEIVYLLNENIPLGVSLDLSLDVEGLQSNVTVDYLFSNETDSDYGLKFVAKEEYVTSSSSESQKRYAMEGNLAFDDNYYQDDLYQKGMMIKKRSYKVTSDEFSDYSSLTISCLVEFDETKTHFITSSEGINHEIYNVHTITNWVTKDELFDLYIIGDDVGEIDWKIYKNSRLLQEVEGSVELVSEEEVSFEELLLKDCPDEINQIDWYNNKIFLLKNDQNYATSFKELELIGKLKSYFIYNLNVKANDVLSHQMKFTIDSEIDDSYSPEVLRFKFNFDYLNKFVEAKIDMTINSSYYLINPNFNFNKVENRYQSEITDFEKDLVISLSSSANPEPNVDMLELSIKVIVSSIAFIVFLALCIFPKRIKRNYYINDFQLRPKVERMYRGQNILAIIAIILSMIGMHYKVWFSAIALIVVFTSFIVALVAHFKYCFHNALGLIVLSLAITSSANLLYQSHDVLEINTVIVTLCILIHGVNNLIIYNDVEKNMDEEHYFLPIDFLSKKSLVCYLLFVFLIMFVGIVILVFEFKVLHIIIISIINLLLVASYRVIKVILVDYRPLNKYYKNLDYLGLKIKMESKLSEDNIHPKTYNGYLLRLAEVSMANDFDDYIKYLSSFKTMNSKAEQVDYDCLRLNYLLSKREFFGLYQELRIKYADYPNLLNKVHKRYNYWLPYYNGEVSESIVLQYPYRTKNKWKNARNLFIQINHYVSRSNYGKARELGKIFKRQYPSLKLFIGTINHLNLNRI